MDCSHFRELVSADLDGELAEGERRSLARHLEGCADCRPYAAKASELHRSLRVHAAPPVPDLVGSVLARLGDAPPSRRPRQLAWRVGLAAVGLIQIVLAGPALVRHPDLTEEMHAIHHLNAWAVAFAVGLLVVAWQPWRVQGVLPIATALAAVMVFTVVLDVHNHHAIVMSATAHLLELAGLVLAWGLARQEAAGAGGDPAGGDGRRQRLTHPGPVAVPDWLRPGGRPGRARAGTVATGRAEDAERAA
jgi:predicted anti-sigma-YlaC factor YlaD